MKKTRKAFLILPHQLYHRHPVFEKKGLAVLWESPFFFSSAMKKTVHQKKLVFHRASMKVFEEALKENRIDVFYAEQGKFPNERHLSEFLKKQGVLQVEMLDPEDPDQESGLKTELNQRGISLFLHSGQGFFLSRHEALNLMQEKAGPAQFLQQVLKKTGAGERFNQAMIPDIRSRRSDLLGCYPPALLLPPFNPWVSEAQKYTAKNFFGSPGNVSHFFYPISRPQAQDWFCDFLETRLSHFSTFFPLIHRRNGILFHSLLSSSLNHGLITPHEALEKALEIAGPSVALFAFLEKMAGIREWCRGFFLFRKRKEMCSKNPLSFFPVSVLSGETGIFPVDAAMRRVIQKGYAGDSERRFILRAFFTLIDIPDEAQEFWFSNFFVDSALFASAANTASGRGNLLFSKDLLRLSNFSGGEWQKTWDTLVYRKIWQRQNRPQFKKSAEKLLQFSSEDLKSLLKQGQNIIEKL